MDQTLVKILNMATSGSYEESNNAIEQAYRYMKKKGKDIKDIEFNSLYNGNVIAIKLIARFSHDYKFQNEQSDYITQWTRAIYGGNEHGNINHEILQKNNQNKHLQRELQQVKTELEKARRELAESEKHYIVENKKLKEEQESIEEYLQVIKEQHQSLIDTLGECQGLANNDALKYREQISKLQQDLKKAQEKNKEANEMRDYMVHAKELQIATIKKELKVLLKTLHFSDSSCVGI